MKTTKQLYTILLLLISLSGCNHFGEAILLPVEGTRQLLGINVKKIGIYDLNSKKWTSFRTDFWGVEEIVRIDEREKIFQTLREYGVAITADKSKGLKLKTVAYDGRVVSETELPPLFRMGALKNYAISSDGVFFVYYRFSTKSLHIYDSRISYESLLLENVASSGFSIKGMNWVSETDLILILSDDEDIGRPQNTIIRINVTNKGIRTLSKPIYLSHFNWAFSRSFKYLAYWEGYRKYDIFGNIKIIDTETGRIVATIRGNKQLISNPCWSPDEHRLGYFKGNNIEVFSLDNNRSVRVKTLRDNYICYSIAFVDENSLLYRDGNLNRRSPSTELHIIDIASGREKEHIGSKDWNKVYVVDDGKKIVAEMGY